MRKNLFVRSLLYSSVVAGSMSAASVAIADSQSLMLEEVVVTARKRSENLQDVPMAVSAFSNDALKNAGVDDILDIANLTPNVVMSETSGLVAGAINVFVRGVGSDPGFSQGVGIYVDDVYLNRTSGAILEVYDVERVEVLKGPQGNLYGRNTIGGAIKYVTRKPGKETEADIDVKVGEYDLLKVTGQASGPLAENVYGGVGFTHRQRDGWQTNTFDGKEYNSVDVMALRGTLLWEPTETMAVSLAVDYSKDESTPSIPNRVAVNAAGINGISNALIGANFIPGLEGTGLYATPSDTSLPTDIDRVTSENVSGYSGYNNYEIETSAVALTITEEINDSWSFKSVTSARFVENVLPFDFDGSSQQFITTVSYRDQVDYTQEFQFNYSSENVNAVIGLYYLDGQQEAAKPSDTQQTARLRFFDAHHKTTYVDDQDETSASIYGSVDWDFAEDWQLSLGGRYTQDTKEISSRATVDQTFYAIAAPGVVIAPGSESQVEMFPGFATGGFGVGPWLPPSLLGGPDLFDPTNVHPSCVAAQAAIAASPSGAFSRATHCSYAENLDDKESWNEFSPSARLSHHLNDKTMVYGGISTGYKAGGFQATGKKSTVYDAEYVTAYTLGLKTTLLDDTLRINAEAFYYDYEDKQLATIALTPGGSLDQTAENVGEVTTTGAEVEVMWAPPVEGLTLMLNVGYLNSEIDAYPSFDNAGNPVDLASTNELGFAPEWTAQARMMYDHQLGDIGVLSFGTDVAYRASSYTDSPVDTTDPLTTAAVSPEHAIWNAMIALRTDDDKWRIALEGKNLEDKRVLVNSFRVSNFVTGGYNAPRQWALSVAYSY